MDVEFESLKQKKLIQINEILKGRFGKSVDFHSLYSIGEYHDDEQGFKVRNQKAYFQISYNEVPYLGAMTMPNCEGLSANDLTGIQELLNLFIGPILYQQFIKNKEMTQNHFNLSPISSGQEAESQDKILLIQDYQNQSASPLQPLSHQIHFFSQSPGRSMRAALELHHILNYESFLHYESFCSSINKAQELFELGRTTIYVNEIQKMELKSVDILVDYARLIQNFEYKNVPLLISSSEFTKEKLYEHMQISASQLEILLQYEVNLDRLSTSNSVFRESLELLLVK